MADDRVLNVMVGQKVLWGGQEVTVVGLTYMGAGVVRVRQASGVEVDVNLRGLKPLPVKVGLDFVPQEVADCLKQMRKVLGGYNGAALAAIIAAFRGPDSRALRDVSSVKRDTTAVIRYHAFGPVAGGYDTHAADQVSQGALTRARGDRDGEHFADHIVSAAKALNLPIR